MLAATSVVTVLAGQLLQLVLEGFVEYFPAGQATVCREDILECVISVLKLVSSLICLPSQALPVLLYPPLH